MRERLVCGSGREAPGSEQRVFTLDRAIAGRQTAVGVENRTQVFFDLGNYLVFSMGDLQ